MDAGSESLRRMVRGVARVWSDRESSVASSHLNTRKGTI